MCYALPHKKNMFQQQAHNLMERTTSVFCHCGSVVAFCFASMIWGCRFNSPRGGPPIITPPRARLEFWLKPAGGWPTVYTQSR